MHPHKLPLPSRASVLVCVLAMIAGLGATAGATPTTVPPGYDLFETDPEHTHFDFQIPADFFDPGSDPFTGRVQFAGDPLGGFMGFDVGDADTVVRRPLPADLTQHPTVPIEIVALSLVSVAPITVTLHNGNSEAWDVRVGLSPSAPSTGQMTIHSGGPAAPDGGTFDSQLLVVPFFTFTRLADGATRTLDGIVLPPQYLHASGVPWRTACKLPALAVPGLNDGFCPSFDGAKQLTIEEALLAVHGIRPAQPALEHFKCYSLQSMGFPDRQVDLVDQFGARHAEVTDRSRLCNPVKKRSEPLINRRAHLVCYTAPGPDIQTPVVVRNQFGSQKLLVHGAETLCVPSQKRELDHPFRQIQVPIDHFQCYAVDALSPLQRVGPIGPVRLADQFGVEKVTVGRAFQLCAPVDKDGSLVQHPVSHLVCYRITGVQLDLRVEVRNQFERREIVARSPRSLCVPSAKVLMP